LRTFGTSFAKHTPFAHRTGMSTEPPAEDLDSETLDDFPISEELDDAATVEEAAAASEDASAQLLLEEPPAETDEMQELVIQYGRAAKHVKMVFREAERAAKEADAAAAVATAEKAKAAAVREKADLLSAELRVRKLQGEEGLIRHEVEEARANSRTAEKELVDERALFAKVQAKVTALDARQANELKDPARKLADATRDSEGVQAEIMALKSRGVTDAAKFGDELGKLMQRAKKIDEEIKRWQARVDQVNKDLDGVRKGIMDEVKAAEAKFAKVEAKLEPVIAEDVTWTRRMEKLIVSSREAIEDLERRRKAVQAAEEVAMAATLASDDAAEAAREARATAESVANTARREEFARVAALDRAELALRVQRAHEAEAKYAARETKKRLKEYKLSRAKMQESYALMLEARANAFGKMDDVGHCAIKSQIPSFRPASPRADGERAVIAPISTPSRRSLSPSSRRSSSPSMSMSTSQSSSSSSTAASSLSRPPLSQRSTAEPSARMPVYPYAGRLITRATASSATGRKGSKSPSGRRRPSARNVTLSVTKDGASPPAASESSPEKQKLLDTLAPPPLLNLRKSSNPKKLAATASGAMVEVPVSPPPAFRPDLVAKVDMTKLAILQEIQLEQWLEELDANAKEFPSGRSDALVWGR